MKTLLNYLSFIVVYSNLLQANTLDITNLTPGQVSISLQTMQQTVPLTVIPANMNPILNDVNEPEPKPTTISFDNSPVEKISIVRFSPNMPQIIYYDNQNTADSDQKSGGMKKLNLSLEQNRMIIWPDYVEIDNVAYSLNDLNSYVVRIKRLKDNLSVGNLDATQTLLDDLSDSLQAVLESEMASALTSQIAIIQSLIDTVRNNIKILRATTKITSDQQDSLHADTQENISKDLDSYLTQANQLKDNITISNLDTTQKQLEVLTASMKTIQASAQTPAISLQIATTQAAIDSASDTVKIIKTIQAHIKELQDLQDNLALGDNNLTGTNKPYKPADDSINRAQRRLNGFKKALVTLTQSSMDGIVVHQIQAFQSAMNGLQNAIDTMQASRLAVNYEELLPPTNDLQTFQNT